MIHGSLRDRDQAVSWIEKDAGMSLVMPAFGSRAIYETVPSSWPLGSFITKSVCSNASFGAASIMARKSAS
jgi:hypothetical protein